jgi:hypothetical protein
LAISPFAQEKDQKTKKQIDFLNAVKIGNLKAVEAIVESGFNLNAIADKKYGTTYAKETLWGKNLKIAKYVNSKGVDILRETGSSRLVICSYLLRGERYKKKKKLIDFIYSLDFDINEYSCGDGTETPLARALSLWFTPTIKKMLEKGADPNMIQDKTYGQNAISLLIKNLPIPPNPKRSSKKDLERYESRKKRFIESAKLLIKFGADPYLKNKGERGDHRGGPLSALEYAKKEIKEAKEGKRDNTIPSEIMKILEKSN